MFWTLDGAQTPIELTASILRQAICLLRVHEYTMALQSGQSGRVVHKEDEKVSWTSTLDDDFLYFNFICPIIIQFKIFIVSSKGFQNDVPLSDLMIEYADLIGQKSNPVSNIMKTLLNAVSSFICSISLSISTRL